MHGRLVRSGMNRVPARPAAAREASDPLPLPPVEPALEDCCGSGCTPCIFDLYHDAYDRYQSALDAWHARQAVAGTGKAGSDSPA